MKDSIFNGKSISHHKKEYFWSALLYRKWLFLHMDVSHLIKTRLLWYISRRRAQRLTNAQRIAWREMFPLPGNRMPDRESLQSGHYRLESGRREEVKETSAIVEWMMGIIKAMSQEGFSSRNANKSEAHLKQGNSVSWNLSSSCLFGFHVI